MLYNLIDGVRYEININSVIEYYVGLRAKPPINKLIDNWMPALKTAYNKNTLYIKHNYSTEYPIYQQEINLPNGGKFYIHFDVEKAIMLSNQYQARKISARYLGSCVDYHPQKELQKYHYESSKPIILVDLPISTQPQKTVIDGHHRLSAKIINDDNILFTCLPIQETQTILSQTFETAWYCFATEVYVACQQENYESCLNFIDEKSIYERYLNL